MRSESLCSRSWGNEELCLLLFKEFLKSTNLVSKLTSLSQASR